jgi:hypothetical protein
LSDINVLIPAGGRHLSLANAAARNVVVDGLAVDQRDADKHADGHAGDQPEHAFRLPQDGERRPTCGTEHVTGVVPGLVCAGLRGEALWPDQPEGDGGDRRGEKGASHAD